MKTFEGKIIDNKYQIMERLGKGGMGSVYLVKDLKLNAFRAIKIIEKNKKNNGLDPMTEVNIMKDIQHPYLPAVMDVSEDLENVYIIMELISGTTLDNVIKVNGIIEEDTVVKWAKGICDVLIYLHTGLDKKIIYKDLKPSNIMVSTDGTRVTIIDFGISQIIEDENQPNIPIGTKGYAPIEQFKTDPINESVDIYSLGVTLYQLLTGMGPKRFKDGFPNLREINPNLSEGIEFIVKKCIQPDPINRYLSIEDVLEDLVNIHMIGQEYENKKKAKRKKVNINLILSASGALLAFAGWANINKSLENKYETLIKEGTEARTEYNIEEATRKFEEALNYKPSDNLAHYQTALTYILSNAHENSISYIKKNVFEKNKRKENDETFNYLLGKSYFMRGQGYYEDAIEYFNKIKNPSKLIDEASDYEDLKEIANCLHEYEKLNNTGEMTNEQLKSMKSKLVKALSGFEEYIGKQKEDITLTTSLYITLANIYQNIPGNLISNTTEKQIIALQNAEKINSDDLNVLRSLAKAYNNKSKEIRNSNIAQRNDYINKAVETYERCLEISGTQTSVVEINREIGDIYFKIAEYKTAETYYKRIIETNKNNYIGYVKMAAVKNVTGDVNKAKEYLKQAQACQVNGAEINDKQYYELKQDLGL